MLYFMPPFHMIEGVTLFPDHEPQNDTLFYYLPSGPRLSVDTVTKKPVFQALQYTGSEAGSLQGGFLSFQTDLGVEEEKKELIQKKLAEILNVTGKRVKPSDVRLVPVPVTGGSVQLMLYGADEKGKSAFVEHMRYSQTPSLYGDNNAIFSVNLTRYGMELVNQAIRGGKNPPIGVIYTLSFAGLQPAYNVKVKANWKKVSERFSTQTKKNYVFFHEDIKDEVSKLTDDKTFEIEITKTIEGGVDAGVDANIAMVVDRLTDMVTNKFFTPVVSNEPDKPAAGLMDGIANSIGGLFSSVVGLGYTFNKTSITTTAISTLNAEVRERIAVKRTISPCAFLGGLSDAAKLSPDSVQKVVFGDDPFFQFRKLTVRSAIDFTAHDIQAIDVTARYGRFPPETVSLGTSDASPPDLSWARDEGNDNVKINYTVRFKNEQGKSVPGRGPTISKSDIAFPGRVFYVTPQPDVYNLTTVEVRPDYGFPWDRYPRVDVELRPAGSSGESAPQNRLPLIKDKGAMYRNFTLAGKSSACEFRVRYTGEPLKGGESLETPWKEWDRNFLEIGDPRPYARSLAISGADVDWADVSKIDLALEYTRAKAMPKGKKTITLTPKKTSDAFNYLCDSIDNALIQYVMKVSARSGDFALKCSVWSDELSLTGPGRDGKVDIQVLAGRGAVRVGLAGDWDSRFDKIQVTVRHVDQDKFLHDAQEILVFTRSSCDPKVWEYFFLKPASYRYKVDYFKGRDVTPVPFVDGDTFELQIPASPR